jgi:hypothetical protein
MMPQDQRSAGCAKYGFTRTSGATYGNVPHFLSNILSLPLSLFLMRKIIKKLIKIFFARELSKSNNKTQHVDHKK